MKKKLLFFALLTTCFNVQAQKEAYNWAFGYGSGLTWNVVRSVTNLTALSDTGATGTTLTGLPSPLSTSISTREGCFSLSDANGNLLFYSDGTTVRNKDNAIMPNGSGLKGNNSSTQSGIIFPYPNGAGKYVAVTLGASVALSSPMMTYSVIDMSLASGLGDVVTTQKNLPFLNGSPGTYSESVTSINIPGSSDYWVIAPGKGNPTYLNAWRFTSTGLSTTPVITAFPAGSVTDQPYGYLKISPNGKNFIWVVGNYSAADSRLVYGDFNIDTGIFSNIKTTNVPGDPYGIEFSPDQKLVYLSVRGSIWIYKADELFSMSSISTVTKKNYGNGDLPGASAAMQLGPDQRLYLIYSENTSQMVIIDDPNNIDSPKLYKTRTGFVPGNTGTGLPSFAASWFNMKPAAKKFACTGYDYKFTTTVDMSGGINAPVKLALDYGDGITGTINLIGGQNTYAIAHPYAAAGTYTVTITPVKADNSTLTSSTVTANVIDCSIQSNRNIRVNLQNTDTQTAP